MKSEKIGRRHWIAYFILLISLPIVSIQGYNAYTRIWFYLWKSQSVSDMVGYRNSHNRVQYEKSDYVGTSIKAVMPTYYDNDMLRIRLRYVLLESGEKVLLGEFITKPELKEMIEINSNTTPSAAVSNDRELLFEKSPGNQEVDIRERNQQHRLGDDG